MRVAPVVRAGLAGGVTFLAGCLLSTSLDGLSGPAQHDAGAPDSDSSITIDGGPEPDATADAGPFCASQSPPPVFCVDFDDGRIDPVFSLIRRSEGEVRLDDATFVSAPSSMLSTLDAPDGCYYADAIKTLPAGFHELHYEFRIFLPHTERDVIFASIQHALPNGDKACQQILALAEPDNLNTQRRGPGDGVINDPHPLTRPIPLGRWTRIGIDVVEKAGVPNISVRVDGEVALPELEVPDCGLGGEANIFVGLYCTGGKHAANFDDVKVDAK